MSLDLDSIFKKLITAQMSYKSANLGFNLIIARLQRKYEGNQTPTELENCLQEINTFCKKYTTVVAKDIDALRIL